MLINDTEYTKILNNVIGTISNAKYDAAISVNLEFVKLNWNIGNIINTNDYWGAKFIENLARDIKLKFPETKGYSVRNFKYMKKFAITFNYQEIIDNEFGKITWYHHQTLMDKIKDKNKYLWYVSKIIENGWSRNLLLHQIGLNLYERQAVSNKIQNFKNTLPSPQSDLAVQTMKDPYIFDFINYREDMIETEVERELVSNITKLLLELGTGFAFVGNQYHLEIGNRDFYIDLLFYNLNLCCYVAIDLKMGEFSPEQAGKMNFYLSALDDIVKKDTDNPSIGLILCKDKNDLIAEYTLKDMTKAIGVSGYKLVRELPKNLQDTLPNISDIKTRIEKNICLDRD